MRRWSRWRAGRSSGVARAALRSDGGTAQILAVRPDGARDQGRFPRRSRYGAGRLAILAGAMRFRQHVLGDVRIASLAYRRLGGARDAKSLEPRLTGLQRYIWSTGKMRMQAALPLLKRYAENDVTFVPIKGAVLLARNPRALTDRFIADVDVLVDHASWEKAVDLALQDGWHTEKGISRDAAVHRMWQTHHSLSLEGGEGAMI